MFEASGFGKEGLYSKQIKEAGELQEKMGISDGDILTKENRAHDLANEIIT